MYANELNKVTNNYANNNGRHNKNTCHCAKCKRVLLPMEGTAFVGGYNGGGYICSSCDSTISYHGGRDSKVGTTKKHGWIISPELECNSCSEGVERYLISLGFNNEMDCTVYREFTGKMFEGSKGLSTILKRLDTEYSNGNFDTTRPNVGTHLNISRKDENGNNLISKYANILDNYSNSLRVGLSDYLYNNANVCRYFFGRDMFGDWAKRVTDCTYTTEHAVYLNFQHLHEGNASRLEWRLAKYNSGVENGGKEAYFRTIDTCKKLTEIILKACEDIQKIESVEGRTESNKAKRMNVCKKATDKMIKYLEKEYSKRNVETIA